MRKSSVKNDSTGSVRILVGIILGLAFSIGILVMTALWRPPVEKKLPADLPPEISGTETLPPGSEPTETEPVPGLETQTAPLTPGMPFPSPGTEAVPAGGENPSESAPAKTIRPEGKPMEGAESPPQTSNPENMLENKEPGKTEEPLAGGQSDAGEETPGEGFSPE